MRVGCEVGEMPTPNLENGACIHFNLPMKAEFIHSSLWIRRTDKNKFCLCTLNKNAQWFIKTDRITVTAIASADKQKFWDCFT